MVTCTPQNNSVCPSVNKKLRVTLDFAFDLGVRAVQLENAQPGRLYTDESVRVSGTKEHSDAVGEPDDPWGSSRDYSEPVTNK
jgi:hypothetical protein